MSQLKKFHIFPSQFGLFPYIFLVYVLFPVFYLTKETGIKQTIGYFMVILFLICYRQLYNSMEKKPFTYWLSLQLLIVFSFSLFYNLNYIFLGFFPANFIGWYRDKRKFYRALIVLGTAELIPFLYHIQSVMTPTKLLYYVPFIVIMMFSPFGIRSMNRRMELEKKLDQANQQIEELIKREERVRIARDLHDTLGHTLSLLTLKSQLVQRLVTVDTERAKAEAREMEITSRSALKQVRELVSDMRAAAITEELLQIQPILRASGITYQYDGDTDFTSISPFTQNIISMCIREAVTNIVKHSHAAHCNVTISQSIEKLVLVVKDDGMGVEKHHQIGNGLRGMQERLALIDGGLKITAHNGTVLTITVPIVNKSEQKGAAI